MKSLRITSKIQKYLSKIPLTRVGGLGAASLWSALSRDQGNEEKSQRQFSSYFT